MSTVWRPGRRMGKQEMFEELMERADTELPVWLLLTSPSLSASAVETAFSATVPVQTMSGNHDARERVQKALTVVSVANNLKQTNRVSRSSGWSQPSDELMIVLLLPLMVRMTGVCLGTSFFSSEDGSLGWCMLGEHSADQVSSSAGHVCSLRPSVAPQPQIFAVEWGCVSGFIHLVTCPLTR